MRAAALEAVGRARRGEGPSLLECATYRWSGHYEGDPERYRTREEIQTMRTQHDPIDGARHRLEALGVEEAEIRQLDDEVKAIVQDAADFAQSSPEPDEAELWTDVLVEG